MRKFLLWLLIPFVAVCVLVVLGIPLMQKDAGYVLIAVGGKVVEMGFWMAVAMSALGGPMPAAVKVYAMSVLKRLTSDYPDLLAEVRLLVEEQLHDASAGFRVRARRDFGLGRGGLD